MFFRAKEDSSYAGYHLSYEVKKLMYDIVAFLCFVVRTVNTFVSIEIWSLFKHDLLFYGLDIQ